MKRLEFLLSHLTSVEKKSKVILEEQVYPRHQVMITRKEQSIDGCNGGFVTGDQASHVLTEVLDLLLGSKRRGEVHQVVNDNARELNDRQAHGHTFSTRF
jgi:hypothetical protein